MDELSRAARIVVVLALLAPSSGCDSPPRTAADEAVRLVEVQEGGSFSDHWRMVREIIPEQDGAGLVAFLRDVAVSPNGDVLVADPSEGNVKLYSRDGQLQAVYGQLGDGPGEFRQVVAADFGADGSVVTLDLTHRRIQVFDVQDARLTRTIALHDTPNPTGFVQLSGGGWMIVSTGLGRNDFPPTLPHRWDIATAHEDDGELVTGALPLSALLPLNETEAGEHWDVMRYFWASEGSGRVLVATNLRPQMWVVDMTSVRAMTEGAVAVQALLFEVPGYRHPRSPTDWSGFQTGQDVIRWMREQFDWFGRPVSTQLGTFVPMTRERYLGDGPVDLVLGPVDVMQDSTWVVLRNGPTVVGAVGDSLIAVHRAGVDQLALGVYVRR